MTPEGTNARDSDSDLDMTGLQERLRKMKVVMTIATTIIRMNNITQMPSLVPRACNRSNSSSKEDSKDDSEVYE